MKTGQFLALTVALVLMGIPAYGATLSYAPDNISPTIAAGAQMSFPLFVSLPPTEVSVYRLRFVDHVEAGNLPAGWLSANPDVTFFSGRMGPAMTMLTIRVPADSPPGLYSGLIISSAMAAHGRAEQGHGVHVAVTVPSSCGEAPRIDLAGPTPSLLWPPDHRMEEVQVSGRVVMPDGCSLREAGYSVDDEYGVHTAVGALTLDESGNFSAAIPVEAWREGQDKDGRHYEITVFAANELGLTTIGPSLVVVPHDMRDK